MGKGLFLSAICDDRAAHIGCRSCRKIFKSNPAVGANGVIFNEKVRVICPLCGTTRDFTRELSEITKFETKKLSCHI